MATVRAGLDELGFDWATGEILYQETDDGTYPGWETADRGMFVSVAHPMLDVEYDSGYGGPHCPRFIARDKSGVYFPCQYDGSTWVEMIPNDWTAYLGEKPDNSPYPGV